MSQRGGRGSRGKKRRWNKRVQLDPLTRDLTWKSLTGAATLFYHARGRRGNGTKVRQEAEKLNFMTRSLEGEILVVFVGHGACNCYAARDHSYMQSQ